MDYLSDNEIDSMFEPEHAEAPQQGQNGAATAIVPMPPPPQLYPLALAQAPNGAAEEQANGQPPIVRLATKKLGPLPAWAWLLVGGSVAGAGYFYYRSRKVTPNANEDSESSSKPSIGDVVASTMVNGGARKWEPSRSSFADQLNRYFQKKGMNSQATVWHDADDAKKKGKMAFVSPLINIEVKKGGAVKADAAFTRFCRREGLNPVMHQDGNIGLYPHSTKRGKEWEEYVDALRDEGQTV